MYIRIAFSIELRLRVSRSLRSLANNTHYLDNLLLLELMIHELEVLYTARYICGPELDTQQCLGRHSLPEYETKFERLYNTGKKSCSKRKLLSGMHVLSLIQEVFSQCA